MKRVPPYPIWIITTLPSPRLCYNYVDSAGHEPNQPEATVAIRREISPLGLKIKELRQLSGLSQAAVTARTDGTASFIGDLERGRIRWIRPAQVEAIARALEVDSGGLWATIPGEQSKEKYIAIHQSDWEVAEERRKQIASLLPDRSYILRTPYGQLGVLMLEVLESLWNLGEGTARQICDRISECRKVEESALYKCLLRMTRQGLLQREEHGVWVYRPVVERDSMVMATPYNRRSPQHRHTHDPRGKGGR